MKVELNGNGSIRRFECGGISLGLFIGNEVEGGPANLYLRRHAATPEWTPLLGPFSPTRFETRPTTGALAGFGSWQGIDYSIALILVEKAGAWFWQVQLENTTSTVQQLDVT